MERVFEVKVEWPDDYGPMWMNVDNLRRCVETKDHIGFDVRIKVTDVTDPII